MKNNALLLVLTGAVLLVVGFLAGSFFSTPRAQGDNPDALVAEWRGSATGTIAALSPTSITMEKDGAHVVIAITPETAIDKSAIDEEGAETLTPLTPEELEVGNAASVAVVLANGQLRAAAIRVIE